MRDIDNTLIISDYRSNREIAARDEAERTRQIDRMLGIVPDAPKPYLMPKTQGLDTLAPAQRTRKTQ